MNLNQLIADIEQYPHGVITKTYVLKHLRELKRDECPNCLKIPVYDMATFDRGIQDVKREVSK